MQRRSIVPHLVLGVLSVLAAGAIALGLLLAPTTTDLTVHNGAGETLLAGQVTAVYSRVSSTPVVQGAVIHLHYQAPDSGHEVAVLNVKGHHVHRATSVHGSTAASLLTPVKDILTVTGFSAQGNRFVNSEPAAKLASPSVASQVTGTIVRTVSVQNGYVVEVTEHLNAHVQGRAVTESDSYRITNIDGWKVPGG